MGPLLRRTVLAIGLFLVGASVATAQLVAHRVTEPPRHFVLDWRSQVLRPGEPVARAPFPASYDNASCPTGLFFTQTPGEEWLDYGTKATGRAGIVSELTFGYGTFALDPAVGGPGVSIGLNVYAGTSGYCNPADPGTQVASIALSGLPGATLPGVAASVTISIDFTGAAFCVADGPIGFSYVELGSGATTGPLTVFAGMCPAGTSDFFDRYPVPAAAGACVSSSSFPIPGIASFVFSMTEDDGTSPATATFRNTTNLPAYTVTQAPQIGGALKATIALQPGALPVSVVAVSTSPVLSATNPLGGGDLLIASTALLLTDLRAAGGLHSLSVPKDASLIGFAVYSQGFRAGTGPAGAPTLDALNAYDLVIGT